MKYNIGNYALASTGEIYLIVKVVEINSFHQFKVETLEGARLGVAEAGIKPLPITPELLERLGFNSNTKINYSLHLSIGWNLEATILQGGRVVFELAFWQPLEKEPDFIAPINVKMNHVHEVQNFVKGFRMGTKELVFITEKTIAK